MALSLIEWNTVARIQEAWTNLFLTIVFGPSSYGEDPWAAFHPGFHRVHADMRVLEERISSLPSAEAAIQYIIDNHQAWWDRYIPDYDRVLVALQCQLRAIRNAHAIAEEYASTDTLIDAACDDSIIELIEPANHSSKWKW